MKQPFYQLLATWPKAFITDTDLWALLDGTDASRYGIVNRAIKEGCLTHMRRGVYVISLTERKVLLDLFEIAQFVYGPSFISLESALDYYNAIPEAVYSIMSVTTKRSNVFSTSLGNFIYKSVPKSHFLLGVERVEGQDASYFIASPWRAIADIMYVQKKYWGNLGELCEDMRIELNWIRRQDLKILKKLAAFYPHNKVRKTLNQFYGELK